jgi:DinB superfamily
VSDLPRWRLPSDLIDGRAPERAICAALNSNDRDRQAIRAEFEGAKATFHSLLESASEEELARPSDGTRWTNRQLLFHMLFGYMVVRALLPLVRIMRRLPDSGRVFAAVLDAGATPFDAINYWGSCGAARLYSTQRMGRKFDAMIAALERRLGAEPEEDMGRSTVFPTRWDPFFKSKMTLSDVYHYPTQHFDVHQRQLTLGGS